MIIATLFSTEPRILNRDLEKAGIEDVKAIYINNLGKNNFIKDKSEYNLLIPGIVKRRHFPELNENYEEILFLAYEGTHANLVREQIDAFLNRSIEEEMNNMLADFIVAKEDDKVVGFAMSWFIMDKCHIGNIQILKCQFEIEIRHCQIGNCQF